MTRSMLPRLRVSASVFAASAAVGAAVLLSGCSAGQVTQTENQQPAISGVNVDSKDRTIQLRNVAFQYSGTSGYESGQAVPLHVRIINQNLTPIRLVGVTSEAGAVVIAGEGVTAPAPSVPPSSPAPATADPASAAGSASASGPASVPPSSAPPSSAPPSSAAPSGPPSNPTIDVEIPVRGLAVLDPSLDRYLQISGLSQDLKPGDTVEVTFRFQTDSGEVVLTTPVPVAIPLSPPPRSPLHFDEGEGH